MLEYFDTINGKQQLPDRQRPEIAPFGELFHYGVTTKWPVK